MTDDMSKGTVNLLSRIESVQRAKDELTEEFIAEKADLEYKLAFLTVSYHDKIRNLNTSLESLRTQLHDQEPR